jgi:hypothetical protein
VRYRRRRGARVVFSPTSPERIREDVPPKVPVVQGTWGGGGKALFPQALADSLVRQRAEARLGLGLLVLGFLMQGGRLLRWLPRGADRDRRNPPRVRGRARDLGGRIPRRAALRPLGGASGSVEDGHGRGKDARPFPKPGAVSPLGHDARPCFTAPASTSSVMLSYFLDLGLWPAKAVKSFRPDISGLSGRGTRESRSFGLCSSKRDALPGVKRSPAERGFSWLSKPC